MGSSRGWRELAMLEKKNKMVEFSLEKTGIRNRIQRGRNPWLLNFDFEDFLDLDGSLDAVSLYTHLGWFLFEFSCWMICGNMPEM